MCASLYVKYLCVVIRRQVSRDRKSGWIYSPGNDVLGRPERRTVRERRSCGKGNRSLGSSRGRSIKSRRRRVQEASAACTGGFLSDFEWVDPNSRNLLACATDRLIFGLVSPSVQLLSAAYNHKRVPRGPCLFVHRVEIG